ncbi:MAG: ABC transporter ATPase [Bacteroidetes bacterium]|nr:ABC transporter ATPase [Bacteroidota bacterium]
MNQAKDNKLPETARVWVYQSQRKLKPEEAATIQVCLNDFLENWTSHKIGVVGTGQLVYNRFLVLMADEDMVKLGGCSIDSSMHFIKAIQQKINTDFFNRLSLAYKVGDDVESCSPEEFKSLVDKGIIHDETIVFNNLIQTKQEFITGWEIPYKDSWHKNLAVSNTPFSSLL